MLFEVSIPFVGANPYDSTLSQNLKFKESILVNVLKDRTNIPVPSDFEIKNGDDLYYKQADTVRFTYTKNREGLTYYLEVEQTSKDKSGHLPETLISLSVDPDQVTGRSNLSYDYIGYWDIKHYLGNYLPFGEYNFKLKIGNAYTPHYQDWVETPPISLSLNSEVQDLNYTLYPSDDLLYPNQLNITWNGDNSSDKAIITIDGVETIESSWSSHRFQVGEFPGSGNFDVKVRLVDYWGNEGDDKTITVDRS